MTEEDRALIRKDTEEIVGRVVGEIVSDALQFISARFDRLESRVDKVEKNVGELKSNVSSLNRRVAHLETSNKRIESKLDASHARFNDHELRFRLLERPA